MKTQKLSTHLWFDKEAVEAADFYMTVFEKSKIINKSVIHDTPSGDCDIVSFELAGQPFMAISAGPYFKLNPSISFHIKCKTKEESETLWAKLSKDGKVRMEFGKYPFSEHYGWCDDKFGVSWQIMYVGDSEIAQKITPVLMFVGDVSGKTEEAMNFYTKIFPESKINMIMHYGNDAEPEKPGTVQYAGFSILGKEFGAMDSAREHKFQFNEAVSFVVHCDTQEEIDFYWDKLSAVPESEQCGWLKDKFGVSWQIVPTIMEAMMTDNDEEKKNRVTQAFLKMKKFDIAELLKVSSD